MTLQKAAKKRRLLDITVKEVSVVGSPAIDEEFVLIKSVDDQGVLETLMKKINAVLAEKGMTVEKLAEETGIDLVKLKEALESGSGLGEEDLVKIAGALDLEKLDDDEEEDDKKKPEDGAAAPPPDASAAPEAKQDPEDGAAPPPGEEGEPKPEEGEGEGGDASMHQKLLMEKLEAIKMAADSIAEMVASATEAKDIHKKLYALSDVIWQIHDSADVAMLTKSADSALREGDDTSVVKAIDFLGEALVKAKEAILKEQGKEPEKKVEKADDKSSEGDDPEVAALKKELEEQRNASEELEKKIAGLEKSGVSKSLPEDDKAAGKLKKKDEWSFLASDIPA